MTPSILFDRVSKKFRRGEHHDSLRDLIPALGRRALGRPAKKVSDDSEFWAVSDVSFEVPAGDALGIIGPNGAGKSTILKLLTRILRPTSGTCEVRGRVGSLIEVAAGFHPDLTGRENVYLQGAIVGMKRADIDAKFEQIVEFAGVGEFIDTPVKRFSSGMNARLGFAIAAHFDPEVLIIDEVLSVGDAAFQARCLDRMRELVIRGVPLVSVSHNMAATLALCSRAILLDRGRVIYSGSAADTVRKYRQTGVHSQRRQTPRHGIQLAGVRLLDGHGEQSDVLADGGRMTIRVGYEAIETIDAPEFGVDIHTAEGSYCFGVSTRLDGQSIERVSGHGYVDLSFASLNLAAGTYFVSAGIHRPGIGLVDHHEFAYPFTVVSDRRTLGIVALDHTWRHEPMGRTAPAGEEVIAS